MGVHRPVHLDCRRDEHWSGVRYVSISNPDSNHAILTPFLACLPSLRPLLRHFGGGSTEPKPSYNNREGPGFSGGSGYSYGSAWAKKSPYHRNGTDNTTTTEGYSSDQNLTEINVRTSVDVRGEEITSGNAGYNLTAYNNARP